GNSSYLCPLPDQRHNYEAKRNAHAYRRRFHSYFPVVIENWSYFGHGKFLKRNAIFICISLYNLIFNSYLLRQIYTIFIIFYSYFKTLLNLIIVSLTLLLDSFA